MITCNFILDSYDLFQNFRKETRSVALLVLCHFFWSTTAQHATTSTSSFWSHVYDVVCKFDDIEVVFDDDNGVATVNKFL